MSNCLKQIAPNYPPNSGFFPILMALGVVSTLGVMSVVMNMFSGMQNKKQVQNHNRREGFYAGEVIAWHGYYRNTAGLPGSGDKGKYVTVIDNQDDNLPHNLFPDKYEPTVGLALNIKNTLEMDSGRSIIRRYTGDNLRYFAHSLGFCGEMSLSRREYKTCLSNKAASPPPKDGWVDLVHIGSQIIDFRSGAGNNAVYGMDIQKDGKIVIVGGHGSTLGAFAKGQCKMWRVMRLNPDGTQDRSFGDYGQVETDLGRIDRCPFNVTVLEEGRILVSGIARERKEPSVDSIQDSESDFVVVRYLSDGSLDKTFGTNGIRYISFKKRAASSGAQAMLVQSDGKIVLGGWSSTDFALARLTPEGNLDSSFGSGGKVITSYPDPNESSIDQLTALALQPDGKIVATGSTRGGDYPHSYLFCRYNADGSLDSTFGEGGMVRKTIPNTTESSLNSPSSVVVQADGKIVVAGAAYFQQQGGTQEDFALMRFTSNGQLDSEFGNGGVVTTNGYGGSSRESVYSIALQPDRKIIATGMSENHSDSNGSGDSSKLGLFYVRYNSDGSLDSKFGDAGKLMLPVLKDSSPDRLEARSVKILSDGKFLTSGQGNYGNGFVARHHSDGSLDLSFNVVGIVRTEFGFSREEATSVAIGPDGKAVISGTIQTGFYAALSRVTMDAKLDLSFGGGTEPICFADDRQHIEGLPGRARPCVNKFDFLRISDKVAIQPDGKIILGGTSANESFMAGRYNPDGTADTGFGTNGTASVGINNGAGMTNHRGAYALVLQKDGKIVLGGNNGDKRFALARLHSTGSLDTNFGTSGIVDSDFKLEGTSLQSTFRDLIEQSDEKIIGAGSSLKPGSDQLGTIVLPKVPDFALVRYLPNGTPDTSFGANGLVLTDFTEFLPDEKEGASRFPAGVGGASPLKKDSWDEAHVLTLQKDGKIIAAGCGGYSMGTQGDKYQSLLARYNTDGSLDTSFGKGGKVLYNFTPHLPETDATGDDCIKGVAILPDERIVVSPGNYGFSGEAARFKSYVLLAVFKSNGILDESIGEKGILKTDLGDYMNYVKGLTLSRDGLLAIAGQTLRSDSQWDFFVDLWKVVGVPPK